MFIARLIRCFGTYRWDLSGNPWHLTSGNLGREAATALPSQGKRNEAMTVSQFAKENDFLIALIAEIESIKANVPKWQVLGKEWVKEEACKCVRGA